MTAPLKPAYLSKIEDHGDFTVWDVDGAYIRGHIDEEFTNFGQHYRFLLFPRMNSGSTMKQSTDETRFFIDHLLTEHRLMAKGVPYDKAIEEADRVERKERVRAGDVRKLTDHGRTARSEEGSRTAVEKA